MRSAKLRRLHTATLLLLDQFVPVLLHLVLRSSLNVTRGFSHTGLRVGYLPAGGRTLLNSLPPPPLVPELARVDPMRSAKLRRLHTASLLLLNQFVPVLNHLLLPRRLHAMGGFSHMVLLAGNLSGRGRTRKFLFGDSEEWSTCRPEWCSFGPLQDLSPVSRQTG
jgi:hypothetical protein